MSATPTKNKSHLEQLRKAASELLNEGKADEALELFMSALEAVLQEVTKLELLLNKLRKAQAGKSSSEKLDANQLSLLFELLEGESESEDEPNVETEFEADDELDKEIVEAETESQEAEEQEGKKPKRKRQRNKAVNTKGLEVRHTFLEVPEHQRDWKVVGEEITQRLHFSPAQFFIEHIHQPILRNPEPQEDGSLGDDRASPTECERGWHGRQRCHRDVDHPEVR